jgi:hypothetical protein
MFLHIYGTVHQQFVLQVKTVTQHSYTQVFCSVVAAEKCVVKSYEKWYTEEWFLHHDSTTHSALTVQKYLAKNPHDNWP